MNVEYLFIILLILLIIIILIIKNKNNKKVFLVSLKLKKLIELNENYNFKKYSKKRFRIKHRARSKVGLRKLTFESIIMYHIENDITLIRTQIESMIYNKDLYIKYLEEYNQINEKTPDDVLLNIKMQEKTFLKTEQRLFKRNKIKDKFNLSAYIYAYYESPKKRNYYKKTKYIKNNELKQFYEIWEQKKNFQITAKFERSIMSDSIRFDVFKRDDYRCRICGVTSQDGAILHVDHIKPVSKGGRTEMVNLQTLCERCNIGKSNK